MYFTYIHTCIQLSWQIQTGSMALQLTVATPISVPFISRLRKFPFYMLIPADMYVIMYMRM